MAILLSPGLDYAQPVNWEAPLNRGLTGWWLVLPRRLGGQRWLDLLGKSHGVLTGMGPSTATSGWGASSRAGGWGEARYDGTNDGIIVPSSPRLQLSAGNFTVSCWLFPRAFGSYLAVFDKGIDSGSRDYSFFFVDTSGSQVFIHLGVAGSTTITLTSAFVTGSWQHLTMSRTANNVVTVYRNGVAGGTTSALTGTGVTAGSLGLGYNQSTGGSHWNGKLDDIRLYNRGLSAGEVQSLYLRSRLRYPQELRWHRPLTVSVLTSLGTPAEVEDLPGAVASGIIIPWAGTVASIPTGWTRVTALDGRYPKVAAAAASPGATGGNATHTHTTAAHVHTTDHVHTVGTTTGTPAFSARDTGTTNLTNPHTHASNPDAPNPTTTLASDTPTLSSASHEPPYLEVLFLSSNGTSMGLPSQALAFWANSAGLPTGWTLADGASGRPETRGRLLKGASTGADGGGSGGSATPHTHTFASHTHSTPYAHTHPGVNSSQAAEALVAGSISGANAAVATATHTHALTFASTSPVITGSTDTAQASAHTPPVIVMACVQNTSGGLSWPTGLLALWSGSIASIPTDWVLCDGTNGTPDLRDRFVQGATTLAGIGGTSGSLTHAHTVTGHTHAVASHSHTVTAATGAGENRTAGAVNTATDTHTHTWPATSSNGFTSGSTAPSVTDLTDTQPPYTTVLVVQWQGVLAQVSFTANVQGVSTTPASLVTTTRLLTANATGTSTTDVAIGAQIRPLTSALAGASVTPAAEVQLVTLRNLTASVQGSSTTPARDVTQGRLLTANALGTSTTPDSLVTFLRTLTGALLGTSTTPDAVSDVPSTRLLTANLSGTSTTPAADAATLRPLTATSTGSSTTPASLVSLDRGLTANVQGSSTTPASLTTLLRSLLANLSGVSVTPPAQSQMLGAELSWSNGRVDFTNVNMVEVASAVTPALLVQAYDGGNPATQIQADIVVDPTTAETTATFLQAQSGYLVGGAAATPGYGQTFTNVDTVTVLGTAHGFGTPNLLVQVYDAAGQRLDGRIQVHQTSYDVTVIFLQPLSGRVVIGSAVPVGPTLNSATAFTNQTTVTLPASTHGRQNANLLVQTVDTTGHQIQGAVSVDPSTADVTVTFLQAVSGTLLLGGGSTAVVRLLTASLAGASTTPVSGSLQVRALIASALGASTTSSADVTSTRLALASLTGASTTRAANAYLTAVRALTANLQGSSTTDVSTQTMARTLTANVLGASTTPSSETAILRPLTTTLQGTSTTDTSAVTIQRTLVVQVTGASVTGDATIILTALRALTASLNGSSTTPFDVLWNQQRRMVAQVLGTSATSAADVTTVRPLTSSLTGTSTTPAAESAAVRLLVANLTGASVTAAADAIITSGRLLTANLQGSSTTAAVDAQVQHVLSAVLTGSSLTPPALAAIERRLIGNLLGASTTSTSAITLGRTLVANLTGASTTKAAAIVVSGLRPLTAALIGGSTTPTSTFTLARSLTVNVLGASLMPPVLTAIQRPLLAVMLGASTTPPGVLVNTALLVSNARGISTTPAAEVTLARTVTANVQGLSTTPASLLTHLRLIQASMVGASVTPDSLAGLIRRLISVVEGSSATPDSLYELARGLTAVVAGITQTSLADVTTERPLGASLQGVSLTPIALLIPNSGEMACRADIQGHSATSAVTIVYRPRQRIGVVPPAGRGVVPTRGDGNGQGKERDRIGHVRPGGRTTVVS